jgi:hypothetical protein
MTSLDGTDRGMIAALRADVLALLTSLATILRASPAKVNARIDPLLARPSQSNVTWPRHAVGVGRI